MEENYKKFINEQEDLVRNYMHPGVYIIRNISKDMLPLLSDRFKDLRTEITHYSGGELALFKINIPDKKKY